MNVKAPETKFLTKEDFPDQAEWIEPLLRAFNSQASALSSGFAQLNGQEAVLSVDLDVPSTYGQAFPKVVATGLSTQARAAYVVGAWKRTSRDDTISTSTVGVFLEWENTTQTDGKQALRIKNISGLTTSVNYRIAIKVEI